MIDDLMRAQAARAAIRGALVRELKRLGGVNDELRALLLADERAGADLRAVCAEYPVIGELPNRGVLADIDLEIVELCA
jgi:hypothetical protein